MTTRELDKSTGVAGYEPLACWWKEGVFIFDLPLRRSANDVPSVGIAT